MTTEQLEEALTLARVGVVHGRAGAVSALAEVHCERIRRSARIAPAWVERVGWPLGAVGYANRG